MKWVELVVSSLLKVSRYPENDRERITFFEYAACRKVSVSERFGKLMCCHYTTAAWNYFEVEVY